MSLQIEQRVCHRALHFEVRIHYDVKVVSNFIGIRADQGTFDDVDGTIEGVQRDFTQLLGEFSLKLRIVMFPETTTTPNNVFPEA